MFYNNIYDALYYLDIKDNIRYLTVTNSKDSYEYFTQNDHILYTVGQGRKRSSGHPSGHQHYSQQVLLNGKDQDEYPVFLIFSDAVQYMGNYRLISYRKTISFEGFMYFEYKLFRRSISKPTRLSEPLIEPIVYSLPSTPKPEESVQTEAPTQLQAQLPVIVPVELVSTHTHCLPRCR
jgi:hypothetical protein